MFALEKNLGQTFTHKAPKGGQAVSIISGQIFKFFPQIFFLTRGEMKSSNREFHFKHLFFIFSVAVISSRI